MKSRLPRIILTAILVLLVSCSKELSQETGHQTTPAQGNFYATIEGVQWDADSLQLIQVGNNGVIISGLSKTGIDQNMSLRSGNEIAGKVIGSHIIQVACNAERFIVQQPVFLENRWRNELLSCGAKPGE